MCKKFLLTILCSSLFVQPAMAAYSCKDESGRQSFQDKPCKPSDYSQTLDLGSERPDESNVKNNVKNNIENAADFSTVSFGLDKENQFSFLYPAGWDYKIESSGKNKASKKIVIRAVDNETVLLIVLSKFKQPITNTKQRLKSLVGAIRVTQKIEEELTYSEMPYNLMNNALSALVVTPQKSKSKPNAKLSSTEHIIVSDKYLVRGSLLAVNTLSADYAKAFSVLTRGVTEKSKNNSANRSFSLGIPNGIEIRESNHSGRSAYEVTTDESKIVLVLPKLNIPYQTVKSGNSRFEFSNLNKKEPIIVSGWVEPSRK